MNRIEVSAVVARLTRLFPEAALGEEELQVFGKALLNIDEKIALAALDEHRLANSFKKPKFDQIIAICYRTKRAAANTGQVEFPSHAQILAKQKGCGEQEAVLRYHRQMYFEQARCIRPSQNQMQDVRDMIAIAQNRRQLCTNQLRGELGVAYDDSLRWAASITLPVEDFKPVLEDLRQNGMVLSPKDERAPGQINAAEIFQGA